MLGRWKQRVSGLLVDVVDERLYGLPLSLAPQSSIAIVSAVTHWAPETPRLDRYRNELAASLLGIPPREANTEGLLVLRRLAASAPNPESDVAFLPQPRAVNVVKACQQWIASDEDVHEDVESAMTQIFVDLAPILQDVPGGHWDFILDVLENNLEVGVPLALRLFMPWADFSSRIRRLWMIRVWLRLREVCG